MAKGVGLRRQCVELRGFKSHSPHQTLDSSINGMGDESGKRLVKRRKFQVILFPQNVITLSLRPSSSLINAKTRVAM